jgi:hypothetical protein
MTNTPTANLPTWEEMSDLDKGAALLHDRKREHEGVTYAVENYPVKYFDDPRLTVLDRRAACRHAATFAGEAERLANDEYRRLYDLALAEPDRRCLWAARDGLRTVPAKTREYAVELLTVSWPESEARLAAMVPSPIWWTPVDESKWALLTRDEPGGEWREVPYKTVTADV